MQGTNPLDQLRGNHLPEAIGLWPPAPGWWILAALVLVLLIAAGFWLIRRWRKNRYRKQGLQRADALLQDYQQHKNARQFTHDCNRLLKQLALHAYPDEDIARLHGKAWQQFLADTGKNPGFTQRNGQALGESRFSPDNTTNVTALHQLTRSWIKRHHA